MSAKNHISFSRIPELGNLELLHAAYTRHQFAPHFHEGHVIGAIEKGQLGFDYRGEKLVACQGQINLADPGEVHNGFAVSESGWQYRMFYLSQGQLASILGDMGDKPLAMPFFKKGVIQDRSLAREILLLHQDFQNSQISFLEKESRLITLLHQVVQRHAPKSFALSRPGKEKKAITLVRECIEENFHAPITLDESSCLAQMGKYYLLRVFRAHTGNTPHAYLSNVRANRAKEMMDQQIPLSQVALAVGLFDQSHLNRIFKKVFGITPGQYCRAG